MYCLKCILKSGILIHAIAPLAGALIAPLIIDRISMLVPLCMVLCLIGGGMLWKAYEKGEAITLTQEQWILDNRKVSNIMKGKAYQCDLQIYGIRHIQGETIEAIHRQYTWNPSFISFILSTEHYSTTAKHEKLMVFFYLTLGRTTNTMKIKIYQYNEKLWGKRE